MQTLIHDGVLLAFDQVGNGSPPLVFVHGWACDRFFVAPQIEYFGSTHRTLAVDLRGYGESDKPRQAYTMEGFADDLAWMCHELGLENPVIIGHSMGGLVALILAARHAALPGAIVMLDMPTELIDGPLATGHPRLQNAEALRRADYRDVVAQLAEGMFLPTDDHDRRAWIGKRMAAVPQYVLQSSFAQGWTCDLQSAAAACKVPALYIQASTERPELDRFKDLCPQLVLGRTVGAGHFHQLEVPGQVNAMIERFLLVSTPIPAKSA